MSAKLPDPDVVTLFRALETNRTISVIELRSITFKKKAAKALGQMVKLNRMLIFITIVVPEHDPETDSATQLRSICRELKEAILENRFFMNVAVMIANHERSNDPIIRNALRSNTVLLN
ncbi:hypothetical protein MRX96_034685 [Rhipicephalus microplus]|uniref:uncharacterized protein LOC142771427 n=1 Tax=Rhipicephalus microplus TaxID=6941 RepID=UPI003F6AF5FC